LISLQTKGTQTSQISLIILLLNSSPVIIFSQFIYEGQSNNIKNQASLGQANCNHASSKIGIKTSILCLYISCIFLLSSLLSRVSRYLFNQTAAGQNIPESVFHFILIISFMKSEVHTIVPILHPQAEKVFEIENNSAHSNSG
jgi:hypothetical protein